VVTVETVSADVDMDDEVSQDDEMSCIRSDTEDSEEEADAAAVEVVEKVSADVDKDDEMGPSGSDTEASEEEAAVETVATDAYMNDEVDQNQGIDSPVASSVDAEVKGDEERNDTNGPSSIAQHGVPEGSANEGEVARCFDELLRRDAEREEEARFAMATAMAMQERAAERISTMEAKLAEITETTKSSHENTKAVKVMMAKIESQESIILQKDEELRVAIRKEGKTAKKQLAESKRYALLQSVAMNIKQEIADDVQHDKNLRAQRIKMMDALNAQKTQCGFTETEEAKSCEAENNWCAPALPRQRKAAEVSCKSY